MIRLQKSIRILGLGVLAAVIATGCAAKKGPGGPAATAAPAPDTHYTVMKGDCLWCISAQSRIYGNPYQWPLIFKANRNIIKDADLIYPDQVLTIDRTASPEEIARAEKHARNRGPWQLGVVEKTDEAYLAGN